MVAMEVRVVRVAAVGLAARYSPSRTRAGQAKAGPSAKTLMLPFP